MTFVRGMAIVLVIMLSYGIGRPAAQDQRLEARAFAESVLKMKDAKQFREMYRDHFHTRMRQQMSEEQWIAAAENVDQQTGPLMTRALESADQSLGAFTFRFNSFYQNGKAFDEVYVAQEDGRLKVIGIWVKPNL